MPDPPSTATQFTLHKDRITIPNIEILDAPGLAAGIDALAAILHACVAGGASVGFIPPFTLDDARNYWRKVERSVTSDATKLIVARMDGEIVATVQLHLDVPANGRHRAEVAKLLVHPNARRQGLARALMAAVETLAVQHQRHLLVLDTRTGDNAESLYRNLGWKTAGVIPQYALSTDGVLCDTTLMFKRLDSESAE